MKWLALGMTLSGQQPYAYVVDAGNFLAKLIFMIEKLNTTWDEYFGQLCLLVSSKSEDPSTQCGCVLVSMSNEVIGTGYNGFPRRVKVTPERLERPLKYSFFEHAERNAIYNCAKNGISTKYAKAYMTGFPCADCARALIQSGIVKVTYLTNERSKEFNERWKDSFEITKQLFKEAEVVLAEYTLQNKYAIIEI